jgi:hypothetical protein
MELPIFTMFPRPQCVAKSRSIPWRTPRNIEVVVVISQELQIHASKLREKRIVKKGQVIEAMIACSSLLICASKKIYTVY